MGSLLKSTLIIPKSAGNTSRTIVTGQPPLVDPEPASVESRDLDKEYDPHSTGLN